MICPVKFEPEMMNVVNTIDHMFDYFRGGQKCVVNNLYGIISSIEREDGSGRCFNIRICLCDGGYVTTFKRFK